MLYYNERTGDREMFVVSYILKEPLIFNKGTKWEKRDDTFLLTTLYVQTEEEAKEIAEKMWKEKTYPIEEYTRYTWNDVKGLTYGKGMFYGRD